MNAMTPDVVEARARFRKNARAIYHYIWRELTIAIAIHLFFFFGGMLTIRYAPAGTLFDLRPKGSAILSEFTERVVVITGFLVLYTLPIFSVRKSIARALRILMFGLFVVFLSASHAGERIAVVRTADSFIFLKRFPFGNTSFLASKLPAVEEAQTTRTRTIYLSWAGEYGLNNSLKCLPVHRSDAVAGAALDGLESALAASGCQATITRPRN